VLLLFLLRENKGNFAFFILGAIVIYILNVIRIALLSVFIYSYPQKEGYYMVFFFPLFIYGVVFVLWLIWVNNYSYAKILLTNKIRFCVALLLILLLVSVRAYENSLFYDPFLSYFKGDFNVMPFLRFASFSHGAVVPLWIKFSLIIRPDLCPFKFTND
jgi:exosortase/archaeosortase family protein